VYVAGSPEPSYDPLSLRGNARHVQAGGARQIDSIPYEATHGVYVVRSVTGPCPGAAPQDSRGCGTWRVLAKVADVALPEPSTRTAPPNPTPTPSPTATGTATSVAGYPTDRALTTAELARLMAGPPLPTNATLVASTTIDIRTDVCPMNSRPTVGVIQGVDPQVCVMGATLSARLPGSTAQGVFAFRYLAPGYLGLLGEITPASSSKVAFKVADGWPLAGKTFLVEGWLGAYPISCPTYIATSGGDPLDPDGQDQCAFNWLTDDPNAEPSTSPNGLLPPGGGRFVGAGGMRLIDAIPSDAPIHGVYVVRNMGQSWRVLAKLADVSLLAPTATTASPIATPPATPIATPTDAQAMAPTGLIGPGNRALTAGELSVLMAADPDHLAGRYVIDVRVPCATDYACFPPKAVLDTVEPDGTLGWVGEVELRSDGFVWTVPQILSNGFERRAGTLYVVDAWISDVDWLTPAQGEEQLHVQIGAYHRFGAGSVGGGPKLHGLFLVADNSYCFSGLASADECWARAEILARLEPAVIP
jgi:hypothetical protein